MTPLVGLPHYGSVLWDLDSSALTMTRSCFIHRPCSTIEFSWQPLAGRGYRVSAKLAFVTRDLVVIARDWFRPRGGRIAQPGGRGKIAGEVQSRLRRLRTGPTFDAKIFGVKLPTDVPASIQERTYTSPIWYTT